MKKIEKLFVDFKELKIIEDWIKDQIMSKEKNIIKSLYKNYRVRKPKKYDEKVNVLKTSQDHLKKFAADLYLDMTHTGNSYFNHLNRCFFRLKDQNGFYQLLKRLKRNKEEFSDVLSELEFNAYFAKRYKIELEPKIKNKKLDSKVRLEVRDILFEIFTPRPYKPLEESKAAIEVPNVSKLKILSKLRDQIIPIKDSIKQPLIIVINTTSSVIDEHDIADSLFGRLRLNMLRDNKTGRIVYNYWDRENNSITDNEPMSHLISGVLIYRINLHIDGTEFKKHLILNKNPKYPLTTKEYKKLNRFDLNKI